MTWEDAAMHLRMLAAREVLVDPLMLKKIANLITHSRCGWSEEGVCPVVAGIFQKSPLTGEDLA